MSRWKEFSLFCQYICQLTTGAAEFSWILVLSFFLSVMSRPWHFLAIPQTKLCQRLGTNSSTYLARKFQNAQASVIKTVCDGNLYFILFAKQTRSAFIVRRKTICYKHEVGTCAFSVDIFRTLSISYASSEEKVRLWSPLSSTFSLPNLSSFSFSDFNLKTVQNLFFSKNLSSFIYLEQKLFKRICLPMINFTNKNCFSDTLRSP